MSDISSSILEKFMSVELQIVNLNNKITNTENSISLLKIDTEEDVKALDDRLNKIDVAKNRIIWMVVVALVAAFIRFVLDGGLNVA